MYIRSGDDPTEILDVPFTIVCPHCATTSGITVISIPRFDYLRRFRPSVTGLVYKCDACNGPIFVQFEVDYATGNAKAIELKEESFELVERPHETYEYHYLPDTVADDFREALTCYSEGCYNAFAAMCRRCLQSSFTELGTDGKSKVHQQLKDAQNTIGLDDESYAILEQIIIAGHDGVHPNLPKLSPSRAGILLELMKDVLYQLFVRQAKLREMVELRKQTIKGGKEP